jgi:fluoride exporter
MKPKMVVKLMLIGAGGFLGAVCRYLMFQGADQFYHRTQFPLGTLLVNAIGSLLIGVLFALAVKHSLFERHSVLHYVFITGFLGAFTTFSAFSQDNLTLMFQGNWGMLWLNIGLHLMLGLGLVAAGYWLTIKLT